MLDACVQFACTSTLLTNRTKSRKMHYLGLILGSVIALGDAFSVQLHQKCRGEVKLQASSGGVAPYVNDPR